MKHKMNPVLDAQLNRNRQRQRGHRRNLSDGRISSATEHLGEDVSISLAREHLIFSMVLTKAPGSLLSN